MKHVLYVPKGTCWAEVVKKIKPIALTIIELRLSEGSQ